MCTTTPSPKLLLSVCMNQRFAFNDERCGAAPSFREVNICLIYDNNRLEWFVVNNSSDGSQREQGSTGEHKNVSLIYGSTCLFHLLGASVEEPPGKEDQNKMHFAYAQAETSLVSSLAAISRVQDSPCS